MKLRFKVFGDLMHELLDAAFVDDAVLLVDEALCPEGVQRSLVHRQAEETRSA